MRCRKPMETREKGKEEQKGMSRERREEKKNIANETRIATVGLKARGERLGSWGGG